MNKTKRNEGKIGESLPPNRRPKRCHLCKKNFAAEKYNEHFETCYRFQSKKIEESRVRPSQRAVQNKPVEVQANVAVRSSTTQKPVENRVSRPDTANKFRIKNLSHSTYNGQGNSNTTGKVQNNSSAIHKIKMEQDTKKQSSRLVEERQRQEQDLMEINKGKKKEEKRQQIKQKEKEEEKKEEIKLENKEIKKQSSRQRRTSLNPENIYSTTQNRIQQVHQQQHSLRRQDRQSIRQSSSNEQVQQIQIRDPPNQRRQQTVTRPIMFAELSQERQRPVQPLFDINNMIANSNSIIEFIRGTEIMSEDQTISTMMAQLQQLNLIAEQILQLNQLGRALSFNIGNVFAARIHELQSAIINQIGIALMRSFNGRLGLELQTLMQQQPELKVGFSSEQIDNLFEQKINLSEKECSICLQEMRGGQMVLQLQCNHIFHPACIREWLISSTKCPLCRCMQQK